MIAAKSPFCEYSDELKFDRKTRWTNSVVRDHYETSKIAEDTLRESRKARIIMENSLERTRDTLKIWSNFEDSYNDSIINLKERIKTNEEEEMRKEEKRLRLETRRNHLSRPTKLCLLRKNVKIESKCLKSLRFR
ncbi:unnamed protein product [Moneuplotes crassus]|uniref:Uncharacterized protein n=1 Tax=Euplotes crassus TaxID=5936 RepID=A0AAD2D283_EUPCR|nr:unnamed protein product [Moneuplotes crassus]